ncbi:MAG: SDR family NAD(P)-dependent oxidoreductase [Thermomicrobiales bacterium]
MAAGLGRLDGKSALVTGAASGIGKATAILFAREGARLVVNDLNESGLLALRDDLRAEGAEVEAVAGDVSEEATVRAMVRWGIDAYGRIDVAVANAGFIPLDDVLTSTVETWDRVMAVDGRGMWLTCKCSIEEMLKTGGGSIVCLSSISGEAGQKRQATYGPAKFVASGITKHLAVEWADRGIRVNAVAPGTIDTERVQALAHEPGGPEYMDAIRKMHPMARIGSPAEVAQAILFLAYADASFITGVVLPVDGGYLAQ